MFLVGELYAFAIHVSGYLIFDKLGQEKHDAFVNVMLDYYRQNATSTIAAFLSESEPQITEAVVKPAVDTFMESYNMSVLTLRIKSNDYRDISSGLFTQIFTGLFWESNGYNTLLAFQEHSREEISHTVRDMVDSFGHEFQKDVQSKLSTVA